MISSDEKHRINDLLNQISETHDVCILMAVESGSRAWGFASEDSDFDVRFIYAEPIDRVMKLFPGRDVIEEEHSLIPDGTGVPVDLVGWSLQKALRLGCASNPQLAEWVSNDSFYQVDPDFLPQLASLTLQSAPRVLGHHYRGLAKKTQLDYLMCDEEPFGKKYLYACRSVLAARFMTENPRVGASPPVLFEELRAAVSVPGEVSREIDELIDWKTRHAEKRGRRRFPVLDGWIDREIRELETSVAAIPEHEVDREIAEAIYAKIMLQAPGAREPDMPYMA